MGNGSGVSRGDRNRNARLERLRVLVPGRRVSRNPPLAHNDLSSAVASLTCVQWLDLRAAQQQADARLAINAAHGKHTDARFVRTFAHEITNECRADTSRKMSDVAATLVANDARDFP